MKVILLTPTLVGSERLDVGDEVEVSDYSGAKMIRRRWAKAAPRTKARAKAKATKEPAAEE